MDTLVLELGSLARQKQSASAVPQKSLTKAQLVLVTKLIHQEDRARALVQWELRKIQEMEIYKEFNMSLSEYQALLSQKNVEANFTHLFSEEFAEIHKELSELKSLLEKEYHEGTPVQMLRAEQALIADIQKKSEGLIVSKQKIIDYFTKLKGLTYSRKYIRTGQIVSKLIKGTMFRTQVEGVENISMHGPC